MNKKKSKKCCIFHKQRPFDESDSENDSDEDDDQGHWEPDRNGVPVWIPPTIAGGQTEHGNGGCGCHHE